MSSHSQSVHGSDTDFEFIDTPKAATPTFEKFEECGVKTTSVSPTIVFLMHDVDSLAIGLQ